MARHKKKARWRIRTMMEGKHTIRSVRTTLLTMWEEGASPVEMIRFLHDRGIVASRVGRAFSDTFGVKMRYRRIANSWREDGSGASADVVNDELTKGIREAAETGGHSGGSDDVSIPDDGMKG